MWGFGGLGVWSFRGLRVSVFRSFCFKNYGFGIVCIPLGFLLGMRAALCVGTSARNTSTTVSVGKHDHCTFIAASQYK